MKNIRVIIFTLLVSAVATNTYTQNITDAMRYSYINPGGTARFMSMGSSFGALGGDFSSLSINPAGIGIYRSSEISFTPSLNYNELASSYYGTENDDFQYNFNIQSAGGVFNYSLTDNQNSPGWRAINFGLGINRHNNFNYRRISEGVNPDNSLLTDWLDKVDGITDPDKFDPFTSLLAYKTDLIYDTIGDGKNWNIDPAAGGLLTRQESNIKGSVREFVLSAGANYNDRLYIGGTFGFPNVSFEEVTTHREEDYQDTIPYLNSFSYKHNLKTTGTGFNFKLGAIFRATDIIRLGAAVHTPTFYDLRDEWRTEVESNITYQEGDTYTETERSQRGRFNYELNTPLKAIGSLGLIFGNQGLINIDYEYIDYTNNRLRSDEYMFTSENNVIKNDLQAQHNIRVGGELVLQPLLLRAGYAYYSNPYQEDVNNTERTVISAGFGIRQQNYSLDFAYMVSMQSENYYPYRKEFTEPMVNDYTRNAFMVTLGYRY